MGKLLCVTIIFASVLELYCYETFKGLIPNGNNVPDPCNSNNNLGGVGHVNGNGGGARNQFGIHFNNNGRVWNETLCSMDSDGDGRSNGVELGDPNCHWDANNSTTDAILQTSVSHPGIDNFNPSCSC